MALNTTNLLGLLLVGFILLFLGMPWWMGVGIIIAALALATGTDDAPMPRSVPTALGRPVPAAMNRPASQGTQKASSQPKPPKPWWIKQREKDDEPGSVLDPLLMRPSVPPDGFCGIGSISTPKEDRVPGDPGNFSVGKRTGAASFYVNENLPGEPRIRIKDDIRFNMPWMDIEDPENPGIKPLTNIVTAHLRTNKKIIKTKVLEQGTFEQWDKELFDGPDFALDK